ncbi:hypothetical protein ND861_11230 [Leptospira sp. 2 VSF19]|uniref:Lipoprotein n=1 Tax=Leptospira soteropolitanensis TaxID=2950025 RepID=A0AAW5VL50_9LEPT|nr:hypothetical protein [Leptospira soteropolitanensis]MCW7493124.1 hypothetical protein [Leptospira soteropolitanensis]MCW7500807.1 hypothetical protein [Leptospira soteropolitanensis]MCW7522974.1 hypothetical protein [Leptospira soteropolitanensis]MCW7526919.1 hypothetical protein [Leptospira soteropolitanensis]MCW7530692.1 hypothetical protein [Leptospira soteropolitanensis]
MRYQVICFSFLVILIFLIQCKESKNPADIAPETSKLPAFGGEWSLEWENQIHSLNILPEENKVLWNGENVLSLELDSVGIRLRPNDEESIKGYFLYSDLKPKSWIGTWENRVVRLIRKGSKE